VAEQPHSSSKASLSAGDRLGRYEIVRLIDEGGMGAVYRAHDPQLRRDVALKIMRWSAATPEQVARFSREAHAAGSLNHPNIVVVLDAGSEQGVPFVVTELLEGETLRHKLRPGPLPFRKAVEIGIQIAQALDAAHRKSIWHRDVKPANVFITSDWRVKLLDFGIAKLSEPEPQRQADVETASLTSGLHGTPGYMSPEQVLGEPVDHRADIFALGAVLYEMFTGQRAFHRESSIETMNAVVHAEPADPLAVNPKLSPLAAAVVHRCLEKNREDRFQSARDLAFQLQQLKEPTTGPISEAVSRSPSPRSRRWLPLVAATLLGGAAVALGVWALTSGSAAPTFERLTFSRGRIGGARFTSDGGGVLYSLATQGYALEISRIDDLAASPTSRRLDYDLGTELLAVRAGEVAVMVRPQFLQFQRFVGTLGVGPFGSRPSDRGSKIEGADWSRSGELAVVRSTGTVGGTSHIEYPQGTSIYNHKANILSYIRVSPDGQLVAFLEDAGGSRGPSGKICVVDRTGTKRELTNAWPSARGLAWSPDGSEIWFAASADDRHNRALRAVTLDGKERVVFQGYGGMTLWDVGPDGSVLLTIDEERRAVRVKAPGGEEHDFSLLDQTGVQAISRDGRKILGGDRLGLFVVGTDGSQLEEHRGEAFADDLAPDGRTILATTDEGRKQIVISPGASGPRLLPPGDIALYKGAFWFPRSRPFRVLVTGRREGEEQQSFVQDADGSSPPTTITAPGTWGVAISQDEQWIAAIQGPHPPIQILPIKAGAAPAREVPGVQDGERPVAFSEDGKALWLFRRGEVPGNVSRVDIASGRRDRAIPLRPPDTAGVYSIVECAITPDGQAYAYTYTRVLSELYLAKGLR